MKPVLSHGQYLLVSRLSYSRHSPARGDIVVAHEPGQSGTDCVKRVIGLPGEYVRIEERGVFIHDCLLREPYLAEDAMFRKDAMSQWLLGDDEYIVLGDNRSDSRDSRRFGPVPRSHIIGKAWIRYWPPAAWGVLSQKRPFLLP